ncbi:MAG: DNA polymerase I [Alphaproteobacteria bacterium]
MAVAGGAGASAPAEVSATPPLSGRPRVCLVDGSGYIFRAYHALPPMTRPDGTPVNAVYGFTAMLLKLIEDNLCDHLAVIFDTSRKTFRADIYADYKANRPPPPEDLAPQFPLIRDAVRAMNVPAIELAGFEADDLIASYARRALEADHDVLIVSSDKDLMQLVGPSVAMLDPVRNRLIGEAEVRERFGVGPDKVVEVQALAGDSSDNVPGVPGIGIKTAADLIRTYGDLESLLSRAEEIKQPKRRQNLMEHAALARISRQLVLLRDDVELPQALETLRCAAPEPEVLLEFLREQAFRTLAQRAASRMGVADSQATEGSDAAQKPLQTDGYTLIQDEAVLQAWIAEATERGVLGLDTETTSLDAVAAELVGVSLALAPGQAAYIPLGHVAPDGADLAERAAGRGEAPEQIPLARAIALLKPLLEDPAVLKVGHNLKYDMVVLGRHGIAVAPYDDTMTLSYVLDNGLHGHGLDALATLMLGHETIKFADVAGSGRNKVTFDHVPLDKALAYAAEDADVTQRLHTLLKPRLVSERMARVYEHIDRPLIATVAAMEQVGIRLDRPQLVRISNEFAERIAALEVEVFRLAGHGFKIGSPRQLGTVLFDEMGLPAVRKTRGGDHATGAEILEDLAAQGHEIAARVMDWRQLSKLKSTYADSLVEQINPRTGRVHTSYALAATSTGRLSSTDPNLQNIPVRTEEGRRIRSAFVAEAGNKLVSLDYSQIELRLVAEMAGIDALRQAFHDGLDIHAMTAAEVFGVPLATMDAATRRRAKAINFGIIYGISPFGLARQLAIPQAEARAYIATYFERFPGIQDYMERTKTACREQGFVETLFGRKCHIAGIRDKNPAHRSFAERQAINAPIQGSAADIIKRAMNRMPAALDDAGLTARMLLQVHDELLFEAPEPEVESLIGVARKVMEAATDPWLTLSVPLVADAGVGDTWDSAH